MVVGAAIQILSDFRPPVAVFQMKVENFLVFFFCPTIFLDVWI